MVTTPPSPEGNHTWDYRVTDSPKMLRETLCVAQAALGTMSTDRSLDRHVARLQRLIDACDRHRPIANNGKHGDLHTSTCGCEDKPGVLVREPVKRIRPFCWHRWRDLNGMVGFFGIAKQCARCNLVEVCHAMSMTYHRGSHEMLVSPERGD